MNDDAARKPKRIRERTKEIRGKDPNWFKNAGLRLSTLLENLDELGCKIGERPRKTQQAILENLIGASFSLWRVAPLVSESARNWSKSFEAAKRVVTDLYQHNEFTYEQERRDGAWFCRFYLKSSELRIERVSKLLYGQAQAVSPQRWPWIKRPNMKPSERWNKAYEELSKLVETFKRELKISSTQHITELRPVRPSARHHR